MKKLALVATITAGVIGLSACSSGDPEVVVETEHGNITKEEFYDELKATAGENVLQNLVLAKILEDRYEIDEKAVEEELEQYKEMYGDSWDDALSANGFSDEDAFRDQLRLQLLQQEAMIDGIEVSDEEVQTRYDRMQTEIEASHILVGDEETANDILAQLNDGGDFAELAEEHSTDTTSAVEGGQLGYFTAGDMVPEFEEAAYSLAIDEISEPVQSTWGWHIIKVTDIKDAETELEDFADISDSIRMDIALSRVDQAAFADKLNEMIDAANIDVKIDEFKTIFEREEPNVPDTDGE